jgi:fatty acid desaturase
MILYCSMTSKVIHRKLAYKKSMSQETAPLPRAISWYRTAIDVQAFKSLHQKSNLLGWFQTLGYLGVLVASGALAMYSVGRWPLGVVLLLTLLYGTFASFMINAVHELGHGTVFRTKALNSFFVRLFAFFNWINFEMFNTSHTRHHRHTLHQPDDLEVVLPQKVLLKQMLAWGIIRPMAVVWAFCETLRIARGQFEGEWELKLFRQGTPERAAAIHWARFLLIGHGLLIVISLYFHLWLLPVLTSLHAYASYGSWLQQLCNSTQHIGLQDEVSDFRLCCRTFTMNPLLQFIYWHMNYHIEHHMYAAVPCYRLGRLHRLIKHDLAPCPHGLIATWKEIFAILKIQETNPGYEHVAALPPASQEKAKPVGDLSAATA